MKIEFIKEKISSHKSICAAVLNVLAQADISLIPQFIAAHPVEFFHEVLASETAPFEVITDNLEYFDYEEISAIVLNPHTPFFVLKKIVCLGKKFMENRCVYAINIQIMINSILSHNNATPEILKVIYDTMSYYCTPYIYTLDKLPTECLLAAYKEEIERSTLRIIEEALNNRGVPLPAK